MNKTLLYFSLIILTIACSSKQTSQNSSSLEAINSEDYAFTKTHQANGYTFSVKASQTQPATILLESKGLSTEFQETISANGLVKETLMLDLDNDGHQEFYLLIPNTSDGDRIALRGFASNNSQSLSEITVMDDRIAERDLGSDQITIENGQLIRRFSKDQTAYTFNYMLMQSESGYLLLPRLATQ